MPQEINWSLVKHPPQDWQPYAVDRMLNQPLPYSSIPGQHFALFDDVGMGKCYDVIATAANRFVRKEIDFVVVLCPANVAGVWIDPITGEIHEHLDIEYSTRHIWRGDPVIRPCKPGDRYLQWYVVNYAYLRRKSNVDLLERSLHNKNFMMIADESGHIKNKGSAQTVGARMLRGWARYRGILTANPMPNSVMDYWSQFDWLDPWAHRKMSIFQFRNKFAKLGGYMGKNVIGINEDNKPMLDKMYAPYVIQRKRVLPQTWAKLPVTMPPDVDKHYESMKEEMLSWLGSDVATAIHAGAKALRLAQITSGFLGGFKTNDCRRCGYDAEIHTDGEAIWIEEDGKYCCERFLGVNLPPREIDRTKLDATIDWLQEHEDMTGIISCRFSAEIDRLSKKMDELGMKHGRIWGGPAVHGNRQNDINMFMQNQLKWMILQPQAGSEGLNLKPAQFILFVSNDYSHWKRYQTEGRPRPRPGHPVLYVDMLMTRSSGKASIDHLIRKKIDTKRANEEWSTEKWRTELLAI